MDELQQVRQHLRITRLRLLETDRTLAALQNSTSWPMTAPLRRFLQRYPRSAVPLCRAIRLLELACKRELTACLGLRWRQFRAQPKQPTNRSSSLTSRRRIAVAWPSASSYTGDYAKQQFSRSAFRRAVFVALGEAEHAVFAEAHDVRGGCRC